MLHAEGHLAGDVLLGVLRPDRGEEPLQRGDVARRRRGEYAVVQGHQVRRQRPAARAAGAAQAARVDLGPAGEVIEAADAVPDAVAGGAPADQQRADAGHRVLGRVAPPGRLAVAVRGPGVVPPGRSGRSTAPRSRSARARCRPADNRARPCRWRRARRASGPRGTAASPPGGRTAP